VQIERTRLPRFKNVERCRRFLYHAHLQLGRVLSVKHAVLESGAHAIFAGYSDGAVRQWDVVSMAPMCVYMDSSSASFCSMALSENARLLTGYSDGTIKLWRIQQQVPSGKDGMPTTHFTHRNFATLKGHSDRVLSLSTMHNLLVTASLDSTVRVWDVDACVAYSYHIYNAEDKSNSMLAVALDPSHSISPGAHGANLRGASFAKTTTVDTTMSHNMSKKSAFGVPNASSFRLPSVTSC